MRDRAASCAQAQIVGSCSGFCSPEGMATTRPYYLKTYLNQSRTHTEHVCDRCRAGYTNGYAIVIDMTGGPGANHAHVDAEASSSLETSSNSLFW